MVDLLVWTASDGVGERGSGIDAIEFCGFDQRAGDSGEVAAGLRTDEEVILATQSDCPQGAFSSAVINPWSVSASDRLVACQTRHTLLAGLG